MKIIITLFLLVFSLNMNAQVYENEALRQKAQSADSKKQSVEPSKNAIVGAIVDKQQNPINADLIKNTFRLVSIDAIDYGSKHTATEMQGFKLEAKEEFARTDIRVSSKLDKMFFISKVIENRYSIKNIGVANDKIGYINCEQCPKLSFKIISNTGNELILETPAQDEGEFYTTRLIFKK